MELKAVEILLLRELIFCSPSDISNNILYDVLANEHLMLLAESDEAGCYLIKDDQGNIYLLGHPEYDRMSLDAEYKRDLAKGMDAEVPVHYYENDDPSTTPLLTWRGHANTLYTNWLNFYVYQATPYKW